MEEGKNLVSGIVSTALKVITNPAGFYREMPKTGGFQHPDNLSGCHNGCKHGDRLHRFVSSHRYQPNGRA